MECFNFDFYRNAYNDISDLSMNAEEAFNHYINHGIYEDRHSNARDLMEEYPNFDWKFYIFFYKDLSKNNITNFEKAICHYVDHGINENRICCENDLVAVKNKTNEMLSSQYDIQKNMELTSDITFYILTRSNKRPIEFKQLRDSITSQIYDKTKIIHVVHYHNDETLQYLQNYPDIQLVHGDTQHGGIYPYNLYLNNINDHIKTVLQSDSYLIYIDDDDYFTNEYAFNSLCHDIKNNPNKIIMWRVARCDQLTGNCYKKKNLTENIALCGFTTDIGDLEYLNFTTNKVALSIIDMKKQSKKTVYWTDNILTQIGHKHTID